MNDLQFRFYIFTVALILSQKNCPNFVTRHHEKMEKNCPMNGNKCTRDNIFENKKYSPSRCSDYPQASRVQTRANQARTQDRSCCTASLFLTEPSNRQTNAFTTDF